MDLKCTILYLKYIQPPVWLLKSGCTQYAAPIHVHNWIRMSAPIILLSSILCFMYCNTFLNVSLSSLVLLVTMVHRNDMAGSMSDLPPFSTQSNFTDMECRMSASFSSSLVKISYMLCRPFFAGEDTFAFI